MFKFPGRAWLLTLCLTVYPLVGHSGDIGAQAFLVQDKIIAGLDGGGFLNRFVGFHFGGSLLFVDENAPSKGVDSIFLGGLLEVHLQGRLNVHPSAEVRVGVGADIWSLWGIDGDEVLYALPAFVEGRFFMTPQWSVYGRGRYYLTSSKNISLGENFDGDEGLPLLFSVGLGRHF